MGATQKSLKSMTGHAFTQFELTQKLLQNLNKFKISPIAKLVLLELSSHFNPKHADIFPKQKTLALKIGCSERSIVRAIQELFKQGLILIECKYTNRYVFSQYTLSSLGISGITEDVKEKIFTSEKLSDDKCQNDRKQYDNLSSACIEQIREQKKEPIRVDDFKILKDYAEKHGAKNVNAYIKVLRKNGSADKIISEYKVQKQAEINTKVMTKKIEDLVEQNKKDALNASSEIPECWKEFKKRLLDLGQK